MEVNLDRTSAEIEEFYAKEVEKLEADEPKPTAFDYLIDKQNSQVFIIKGLIESELFFNTVYPYLSPSTFEGVDETLLSMFKFIQAFYSKYGKAPTYGDIQSDGQHLYDEVTSYAWIQEMQKVPQPHYEDTNDIIYDVARTTIFSQVVRKETFDYLQGIGMYSGKYKEKNMTYQDWRKQCDIEVAQKIQAAAEITFDIKQGISMMQSEQQTIIEGEKLHISTGIQSLDYMLGGGFVDKSLNIILANTGGGKTSFMLHLACKMVEAGYRVLYLSLEIPEWDILTKTYAHMCQHSSNHLKHVPDFVMKQKKETFGKNGGDMVIKDYPAGALKASTIMQKLKFEASLGMYYDAIFVDYLGLMDSDRGYNKDGTYLKYKNVAEELHSLSKNAPAKDRTGLPIITAVQSVRGATNNKSLEDILDVDDISQSIGIAQTADTIIGLSRLKNENYAKVKNFDLIEWIQTNPTDIVDAKRNFSLVKVIKNRNTGYLNTLILEARFDYVKFFDINRNLNHIGCSDEYNSEYLIVKNAALCKMQGVMDDLNKQYFKTIQEMNAELLNEVNGERSVIKEIEITPPIDDNGECDIKGNVIVSNSKVTQNETQSTIEMPILEQSTIIEQPTIEMPIVEQPVQQNSNEQKYERYKRPTNGIVRAVLGNGSVMEIIPLDMMEQNQSNEPTILTESVETTLNESNDVHINELISKTKLEIENVENERKQSDITSDREFETMKEKASRSGNNKKKVLAWIKQTISSCEQSITRLQDNIIELNQKIEQFNVDKNRIEQSNDEYEIDSLKHQSLYNEANLREVEYDKKRVEMLQQRISDLNAMQHHLTKPVFQIDDLNVDGYGSHFDEETAEVKLNSYLGYFNLSKEKLPKKEELIQIAINDSTKLINGLWNKLATCDEAEVKTIIKAFQSKEENGMVNTYMHQKRLRINSKLVEYLHQATQMNNVKLKNDYLNSRIEDVTEAIETLYVNHSNTKDVQPKETVDTFEQKCSSLINTILNVFKIYSSNAKETYDKIARRLELYEDGKFKDFKRMPISFAFSELLPEKQSNVDFDGLFEKDMMSVYKLICIIENLPYKLTRKYYSYRDLFFKVKLAQSLNYDVDKKEFIDAKCFIESVCKWGASGDIQYLMNVPQMFENIQHMGMVTRTATTTIIHILMGEKCGIKALPKPFEIVKRMENHFKENIDFLINLSKLETSKINVMNDGTLVNVLDWKMPNEVLNYTDELIRCLISGASYDNHLISDVKAIRKSIAKVTTKKNRRNRDISKNEMYSVYTPIHSPIQTNGNVEMSIKEHLNHLIEHNQFAKRNDIIEVKPIEKYERVEQKSKQTIDHSDNEKNTIVDDVKLAGEIDTLTFTSIPILTKQNLSAWVDKFIQANKDTQFFTYGMVKRAFYKFIGYEKVGKNKFIKLDNAVKVEDGVFNKKVISVEDKYREMTDTDINVILQELLIKDKQSTEDKQTLKMCAEFIDKTMKKIAYDNVDKIVQDTLNEIEQSDERKQAIEKCKEFLDTKLNNVQIVDDTEKLMGLKEAQLDTEDVNLNVQKLNDIRDENQHVKQTLTSMSEALSGAVSALCEGNKELSEAIYGIKEGDIHSLKQTLKNNTSTIKDNITNEDLQLLINFYKAKGKQLGNIKLFQNIIDYLENMKYIDVEQRPIKGVIENECYQKSLKYTQPNKTYDDFKQAVEDEAKSDIDKAIDAAIENAGIYKYEYLTHIPNMSDEEAEIATKARKEIEKDAQRVLREAEEAGYSEDVLWWITTKNIERCLLLDDRPLIIPDYIKYPKNSIKLANHLAPFHIEEDLKEVKCEKLSRKQIISYLNANFIKYDETMSDDELEMFAFSNYLSNSPYESVISECEETQKLEAITHCISKLIDREDIDELRSKIEQIKHPKKGDVLKKEILSYYDKYFSDANIAMNLSEKFIDSGKLPTSYEYYNLISHYEMRTSIFRDFLKKMKIVCNPEFYKMFDEYLQFHNFKLKTKDMEHYDSNEDIKMKKANIVKGLYALQNLESIFIYDNEMALIKNKWLIPVLYKDEQYGEWKNKEGIPYTKNHRLITELNEKEYLEYEAECFNEMKYMSHITREAEHIINSMKAIIEQGKFEDEQFLKNLDNV